MIIKGRSPMMRHLSRIYRVTSDQWLDRINLDPKIENKYVDTKTSKESFTRDEWGYLLRLLNIMNFSDVPADRQLDFEICVGNHQETGVKQRSKPSNVFSREE